MHRRLPHETRAEYIRRLLVTSTPRTAPMKKRDRVATLLPSTNGKHEKATTPGVRTVDEPKPPPARGTYDHVRCGCCGRPYQDHTDDCPRHEYRPEWAKWITANPVKTARSPKKWRKTAAKAGVPAVVIDAILEPSLDSDVPPR